ncbi:MAG: pyruvate/2-oxoglutarate/acetoin dehydrogenase E1 component/TPP-dependent pyruvate [Bacteroidia bacterium]|jgi:pyruvate/2-oxoglutarate/acetoin dehydrogenase E1 component/TPP-dependent pyruvate/acetoin dehydrogenase alpha subunit
MATDAATQSTASISKQEFIDQVKSDYITAYTSRQASLIGRKEVLTGKAKFGIFGDGKEIAQVAMARYMQKGDFRAGYYRDQTIMFALGLSTVQKFFAQLYAHPSTEHEPSSAGRSMNGHFGTRMLDENGEWLPQTDRINISSDISPTAGQMPRALGLAFASKVYKSNEDLHSHTDFSKKGNELSWVTIGNASTSEGHFWESINAAGVMQVPMLVSIWDDEYGISVHAKHQTTKQNLSALLSGFKTDKFGTGIELITVNGWDYPALINAYKKAAEVCRNKHTPVVVHVKELTQPQGHSTSGSHERYKSKDRLQWEVEHDCVTKMRAWILENNIAESEELATLEKQAETEVKEAKKAAWTAYTGEIKAEVLEAVSLLNDVDAEAASNLQSTMDPGRKDILKTIHSVLRNNIGSTPINTLQEYYTNYLTKYQDTYSSHLHSQSPQSALKVQEIKPEYGDDNAELNGFEILNRNFDRILSSHPEVIAFGEDVGKIGDVNQGFAGLQEKHGEHRVMDMGIRENTIVGQAVGASLRGLRPIAEIQYLDYLLYGLQIMSDDIATIQYRTKGGQKYPLIIRTRGHRLEGIWHSGSPMGMILNAVRGMNVLVPRDMTRAAGFYNTLLKSDEPALIIECLNGYRLKEKVPTNLSEFTVPVGVPETLQYGEDVTVVTYGSCVRIAQEGIALLAEKGISVELIDVQSLLPFDVNHNIVESLMKTNKVVFMDEDVKGGATGFMMQKVLEEQEGYKYLDAAPRTLTSQDHRPAYGSDGDYFSKSNAEELFELVYDMMHENEPSKFSKF